MSPAVSQGCPYCNHNVVLEAPLPFGLTTCSHCGEQVRFLTVCSALSFFRYEAASLVGKLFHQQQPPGELQFDILDVMELIRDFEAALKEAS